jgi:hypothetical protein
MDYLKDDIGDRMEQFVQILKVVEKNADQDTEVINSKLYQLQIAKEKNLKTPYKITKTCHSGQNLWLLKPTGFNRGIGIHIF